MRAGVAADAREAVLEDAAGEELVGHLPDDEALRATLKAQEKPQRAPPAPRLLSALRDCEARSVRETLARIVTTALREGLFRRIVSVSRCLGVSRSRCLGVTMLAADTRTSHSHIAKHLPVSTQQTPAFGRRTFRSQLGKELHVS